MRNLLSIEIGNMQYVKFIGEVHSSLKELKDCPLQESEGAPQAILLITKEYLSALSGLQKGARIWLFTWLHQAERNTLTTQPRNNPKAPITGIFATRSPNRPNPVGLHEATILDINENEIKVSALEVLNKTPIIDIKPVLD